MRTPIGVQSACSVAVRYAENRSSICFYLPNQPRISTGGVDLRSLFIMFLARTKPRWGLLLFFIPYPGFENPGLSTKRLWRWCWRIQQQLGEQRGRATWSSSPADDALHGDCPRNSGSRFPIARWKHGKRAQNTEVLAAWRLIVCWRCSCKRIRRIQQQRGRASRQVPHSSRATAFMFCEPLKTRCHKRENDDE